uniref:CSON014502 protein n=1 Tax=Culicoides sonorensis TaxID=179676 RepID=A0A336L1J9_CULSO
MSSGLANPDFAIICAFFERFSDLCGIEKQDSKQLIEWLSNTDDVHPDLAELHMKLLRKLRKTVHASKWEKALIKFCYMSTSMQDAWEIERFGYKKASLAVKLRVLKALLEYQFDLNVKFKNAINLATANDLRGTPIGKDEFGNAYWYFLDDKCNIFIYQENPDDETWRLVANNREELVQLIQKLKDRTPVAPPNEDIIDEEDSSNSIPEIPLKIKTEENRLDEEQKEPEIEKDINSSNKMSSLKITLKQPNEAGVSEIINKNEETESIHSTHEVTSHQSSDSPLKLTITTKSRKGTPRKTTNVSETVEDQSSTDLLENENPPDKETPAKRGRGGRPRKSKSPISSKTPPKQETPPSMKITTKRGGTTRGGKRARRSGRNTRSHKASDSDEVGSEIEDPVLHVKGEGSGVENKSLSMVFECSEVIEENLMMFYGEGSGHQCLVGNPQPNNDTTTNKSKIEDTTTTPILKQTFFFGSPGCLKNKPMSSGGSIFGSTSMFSFGGQATFGASSSTTKIKTNEMKDENISKTVTDNISFKPCISYTSPKPLQSLPVSKLGNTQNFEDIIDDDLEPSDDTSEIKNCESEEIRIQLKNSTQDTQNLSKNSKEISAFDSSISTENLSSLKQDESSPQLDKTTSNFSLEKTPEIHNENNIVSSESIISNIPLPESAPPKEVPEKSIREHSSVENTSQIITLSEISLPEEHGQSDDYVTLKDKQDEASNISSEIQDEISLSDIPLPPEPSNVEVIKQLSVVEDNRIEEKEPFATSIEIEVTSQKDDKVEDISHKESDSVLPVNTKLMDEDSESSENINKTSLSPRTSHRQENIVVDESGDDCNKEKESDTAIIQDNEDVVTKSIMHDEESSEKTNTYSLPPGSSLREERSDEAIPTSEAQEIEKSCVEKIEVNEAISQENDKQVEELSHKESNLLLSVDAKSINEEGELSEPPRPSPKEEVTEISINKDGESLKTIIDPLPLGPSTREEVTNEVRPTSDGGENCKETNESFLHIDEESNQKNDEKVEEPIHQESVLPKPIKEDGESPQKTNKDPLPPREEITDEVRPASEVGDKIQETKESCVENIEINEELNKNNDEQVAEFSNKESNLLLSVGAINEEGESSEPPRPSTKEEVTEKVIPTCEGEDDYHEIKESCIEKNEINAELNQNDNEQVKDNSNKESKSLDASSIKVDDEKTQDSNKTHTKLTSLVPYDSEDSTSMSSLIENDKQITEKCLDMQRKIEDQSNNSTLNYTDDTDKQFVMEKKLQLETQIVEKISSTANLPTEDKNASNTEEVKTNVNALPTTYNESISCSSTSKISDEKNLVQVTVEVETSKTTEKDVEVHKNSVTYFEENTSVLSSTNLNENIQMVSESKSITGYCSSENNIKSGQNVFSEQLSRVETSPTEKQKDSTIPANNEPLSLTTQTGKLTDSQSMQEPSQAIKTMSSENVSEKSIELSCKTFKDVEQKTDDSTDNKLNVDIIKEDLLNKNNKREYEIKEIEGEMMQNKILETSENAHTKFENTTALKPESPPHTLIKTQDICGKDKKHDSALMNFAVAESKIEKEIFKRNTQLQNRSEQPEEINEKICPKSEIREEMEGESSRAIQIIEEKTELSCKMDGSEICKNDNENLKEEIFKQTPKRMDLVVEKIKEQEKLDSTLEDEKVKKVETPTELSTEYQEKKKRAKTELTGSFKERILFRPQFDIIQTTEVQQPSTSSKEITIQEKQEQITKTENIVEKSSAEHSNVSSVDQEPEEQQQFVPFDESQNANDALYASSTESSKNEITDDTSIYVSKRKKAVQRTTFNDFSVSKLIGNDRSNRKDEKCNENETCIKENSISANTEKCMTTSPVKHSIESMMAKSPRSSPSPNLQTNEQTEPLDLQKVSIPENVLDKVCSVNEEKVKIVQENTNRKRSRGRGRRKESNDLDSCPSHTENILEQNIEQPPPKKQQIIETPAEEKSSFDLSTEQQQIVQTETITSTCKTQEEPPSKVRARGRKKAVPVKHETEKEDIVKNINVDELKPPEQKNNMEVQTKRPRKSVSPEKIIPNTVIADLKLASPEKIAPKLRAKALAKKTVSHEANESTNQVENQSKTVEKEDLRIKPSIENTDVEKEVRSSRTRQKRMPNEQVINTPTIKELKTDDISPIKPISRSRKRRMSEEESHKRQSSESETDLFDQHIAAEHPINSSDEDFNAPTGKRAKIRGKQIDSSLRKEIELKKQQEIPTTSASEDDNLPKTRGGRQTRRSTQMILSSPTDKKRNLINDSTTSPSKEELAKKVEDKKVTDVTTSHATEKIEEEPTVGRRGKGKRRNEPASKTQDKASNFDVNTIAQNVEILSKCVDENKVSDESIPVKSPDTKKAKIENTEPVNEPKAEQTVQEPKKRGGRPKKSTSLETTQQVSEITPSKKSINAVSSEIDPSNVIQTVDNDTPVRQSRRIAQAKIREEAERRKMEEIMLAQLKADNEKKKKQEAKDKDFVPKGFKVSSDSDNEDSNSSSRKRTRNKKGKKDKKTWRTSDESSSDDPEEEEDHNSEPDVRHAELKSDHEFSCESEDEDGQVVPTKRARTVKKEDQSEIDDDNPEHACQKCHKTDHPEWILLCDSCDKGYHCSCLKPVLFLIPEGDWYCPPCQHVKLVDILEQKLVDFDDLTRQLELAEISRQRAEKLAAEKEAEEKAEKERFDAERKIEEELNAKKKASSNSSNSSDDQSSESDSDDDKPLYKLRKRNQAPLTYNFNEYDEMINRAIKKDMEEVEEANQGSGNAGRGKDISTIIEADKEEKRRKSLALDDHEVNNEKELGETSESEKSDKKTENESEDEGIKREKVEKTVGSKKPRKKQRRKLNQLDSSSNEDDPTDESFKGTSDNSSDEENFSASSAETESSLELAAYRRKGNKDGRPYATRRRRQTRIDQKFINDDSGEESDVKPTRKKKKKSDSEEFELSDDSEEGSVVSEESEDVDSEELCDDSDSDSDDSQYRWSKKKKKRESSGVSIQAAGKQPRKGFGKKRSTKKVEDEDKAFRAGISKKKILGEKKNKEESDDSDDSDKPIRKTRGRQMHYLEDDFESSDEGIKPGVFRPDTPPEEREAFIRKQEEIKRMLAEKNAEGAKALAIPNIEAPADNISIIPASVIETAKVLDADYHKIKPGQSVFDDLPDDFNPDEMDDEELAKMMEEEDFAQHQLKLAGESKNKKLKEGESPSKKPLIMPDPSVLPTNLVKLPKQVEKKLKKKKEEEDIESEQSVLVQAPIANIPTEAEIKAREIQSSQHLLSKPFNIGPPNVTIANQNQLSGKASSILQQHHGPPPHLYQGPPRYPPGANLPPHVYAQMRPGIQPHPGMPSFTGHPPQHLSNMYPQNMRMPSNLNPALRSLMNMPPNLPQNSQHHQLSHQRQHGVPPMNSLMAMSQIPPGTRGPPPPMHRNLPPPLQKDIQSTSLPTSRTPPKIQQPVIQQKETSPVITQKPEEEVTPVKKRGRRKKITPLRDDLPKTDPNQSMMQMKPEFKVQGVTSAQSEGPKLSVVGQPQLFSLTQSAPASVITRVIPQSTGLANISKTSPGPSTVLQQPPQLYSKSPPHPSQRGTSSSAGTTPPLSIPSKSSPHLPSTEPGRLSAIHSQPSAYRHSPSSVIYHGGPPPGSGRVYNEPMPIHHRILHGAPNASGTTPIGARSPTHRPAGYPGQYPPHHMGPHQYGPYPYPAPPPSSTSTPSTENRSPAHSASSAGSPYQPPGNRTPQTFSNEDDRPRSESTGAASGGGGAGEFSGLVSYFSSQHDDLNS